MKVLQCLNEYLCVIGNEEFTTNKKAQFIKTRRVEYDLLPPAVKSRILEAYRKYQKQFQSGTFRM